MGVSSFHGEDIRALADKHGIRHCVGEAGDVASSELRTTVRLGGTYGVLI